MKKTNKNKRIIGGMVVDTVYVKIIDILPKPEFINIFSQTSIPGLSEYGIGTIIKGMELTLIHCGKGVYSLNLLHMGCQVFVEALW